MLFKKDEISPDAFWREYEEKTGEKVLARGLGKYVSGWDEFDKNRWNGLWGLIINTTGGFKFHHFPQKSIFDALFQSAAGEKELPKEKTIFLPREKIISQTFIKEDKWWKRLFSDSTPRLVINYRDEKDKKLIFEAEFTKEGIS
jgi:hypothetical protein